MTTFYLVGEHIVSDEGAFDLWLFSDENDAMRSAEKYLAYRRKAFDFPDLPMTTYPPDWDHIAVGEYTEEGDYIWVQRIELDAGIR